MLKYKTKKALDEANRQKGELGRKQAGIKYIIDSYTNLFINNIPPSELIDSLKSLSKTFAELRNLLIRFKKEEKYLALDLPNLLVRDLVLLFITPEKELAHFDYNEKYKNHSYTKEIMDSITEFQNGKPLKGYGIILDLEDEINLMSLFEAEGLVKRADNAIMICKWLVDCLQLKIIKLEGVQI
jgi:hypothetical protein